MAGAFVIASQCVAVTEAADRSSQPMALVGQESVARNEIRNRLCARKRWKDA